MVAGDAARALGALGQRASPSVRALVKTLSHEDPYVRIYAAEALASIGPKAASRRPRTSPEPWAIRFPAFDGRRVRPSQASARLRSLQCRS